MNKVKSVIFNKINYLLIIVFGFTGQALAMGGQRGAEALGPWKSQNLGNFKTLLDQKILPFAFGAAGVAFVILFIVGGLQYLTSAGNEEASTKAKKLLLDAVIGIVIVVSAWAIANWVLSGLGGYADFGQ